MYTLFQGKVENGGSLKAILPARMLSAEQMKSENPLYDELKREAGIPMHQCSFDFVNGGFGDVSHYVNEFSRGWVYREFEEGGVYMPSSKKPKFGCGVGLIDMLAKKPGQLEELYGGLLGEAPVKTIKITPSDILGNFSTPAVTRTEYGVRHPQYWILAKLRDEEVLLDLRENKVFSA